MDKNERDERNRRLQAQEAAQMRAHMRGGTYERTGTPVEITRAFGPNARLIGTTGRIPRGWAAVPADAALAEADQLANDRDHGVVPPHFDPGSREAEDRALGPAEVVAQARPLGVGDSATHPDLRHSRGRI